MRVKRLHKLQRFGFLLSKKNVSLSTTDQFSIETNLLKNRLLTYPIIATSSIINYKIIHSVFGMDAMAKFMFIWTFIGLLSALESTVGTEISNQIILGASYSRIREHFRKVIISVFSIGILLLVLLLPLLQNEVIKNTISIRHPDVSHLTNIVLATWLCCLFAFLTQLGLRIYIGFKEYVTIQWAMAFAALFSTIMLSCTLKIRVPFEVGILFACSNFLVTLPILYILSSKVRESVKNVWKAQKFGSVKLDHRFPRTYFFVTVLFLLLSMFPRFYIASAGAENEFIKYNFALVLITSFMSLFAVMGQVIWGEAISNKNQKDYQISARFRKTSLVNLVMVLPFFAAWSVLEDYLIPNVNLGSSFSLLIPSFLFFAIQNYHLHGSNVLNHGKLMQFQLRMMLIQLAVVILALNFSGFPITADRVIWIQVLVLASLGIIPNTLKMKNLQRMHNL